MHTNADTPSVCTPWLNSLNHLVIVCAYTFSEAATNFPFIWFYIRVGGAKEKKYKVAYLTKLNKLGDLSSLIIRVFVI